MKLDNFYPLAYSDYCLHFHCYSYSIGSWARHETPEEGQRTHQPKHCEYNNEDNSLNSLSDKKKKMVISLFNRVGDRGKYINCL